MNQQSTKQIEERILILKNYTSSSLKHIEAKHAALITASIFLIGCIERHFTPYDHPFNSLIATFKLATELNLILVIVLSAFAFFPRKRCSRQKIHTPKEANLFKCETLTRFTSKELLNRLNNGIPEIEPTLFHKQQAEHIIIEAEISTRKYRLFRASMYCLASCALLFTTFLLIEILF